MKLEEEMDAEKVRATFCILICTAFVTLQSKIDDWLSSLCFIESQGYINATWICLHVVWFIVAAILYHTSARRCLHAKWLQKCRAQANDAVCSHCQHLRISNRGIPRLLAGNMQEYLFKRAVKLICKYM